MPYAQVDHVRMFYTDEGSGSPIVLVHGWTCDGGDWSWQIPAFRARHRVITVDLRGHGRSEVSEAGYTPRQFAADVASLLNELGTGPVVAMGHSLGGQIVAAMAAEHPELVRAIVPVDAAFGWGEGSRAPLGALAAAMQGPDAATTAAGVFATFYPPACPPHLAVLHQRRLFGMAPEVIGKTFKGLVEGDGQWSWRERSEELASRVRVPALTFRGGGDPTGTAAWERSVFVVPGSKAIAWEGSGHFLHQERPGEFNAVALAWMEAIGANRA